MVFPTEYVILVKNSNKDWFHIADKSNFFLIALLEAHIYKKKYKFVEIRNNKTAWRV